MVDVEGEAAIGWKAEEAPIDGRKTKDEDDAAAAAAATPPGTPPRCATKPICGEKGSE